MLARCPALLSSKCCRWRCLNHDVLSSRIRVSPFASLSSPLPEVPKLKNQKKGKKNVTQIQVETNLSTHPEQAPEQPPAQQASTKKPKKPRKSKKQQQQQPQLQSQPQPQPQQPQQQQQKQPQQQQQPEAEATTPQQTQQKEKATKKKGRSKAGIDISIPLVPLEQSQPQRTNLQSARDLAQKITFQHKEWKLSRKALAKPMTTPTPLIPAHATPVQPAPAKPPLPFGLSTLTLTACEEEQQRLEDLRTFVQSVSWTQFQQFLISFHESHWKDALTHKRRWHNFIEHSYRIFGPETRLLVELIGPHLHKLTAETIYQARKDSVEGIPLSGDVPYLVGFTSSPKSCPCSTEDCRSESGGQFGCRCYFQRDVEIIGRDAINEETQQRLSKLTKLKHKVFVENLHPEIGVRELMKMFCKIGHVEAVELFREKLSGEGDDALTSLFGEKPKKKKSKKGILRRQVTGLSPVYAWVYFSEASGVERALLPVVRILGINFLKHEARTHPFAEKRVLHLGNLPQMPIGGFEAHVMGLLNGMNNANLVQLLHPPTTDSLQESARQGFCLAEFTDHNAALAAFQKLTSGARDSDEKRKLRVGWATEEVDKSSQVRIRSVERHEVRTTHQNRLDREVRASSMAALPNLMSGRPRNDDWSDDPDTLNDDYEERPVRVIHSTSGTTSATIGVNGQPSIVLKRVGQFVTRTGQVLG